MLHATMKTRVAAAVLALLTGSALPAVAAGNADAILAQDRAAKGNITEFGGARRLSSDQTEALKAAIGQTKAKNVILFIGDGMGIPKLPWRVTMQKARVACLKELIPCR